MKRKKPVNYMIIFDAVMMFLICICYCIWMGVQSANDLGAFRFIHGDFGHIVFNSRYLRMTALVFGGLILFVILICIGRSFHVRLSIRICSKTIVLDNRTAKDCRHEWYGSVPAVVILAAIFALGIIMACKAERTLARQGRIDDIRKMIRDQKYIVHAMGYIEDDEGEVYDYTNSFEALNNCYEEGNRVCEIDFTMTSDMRLVCSHYWGNLSEDFYGKGKTYEAFMHARVYDRFTTVDFETLAGFMRDHTDFYVITDTKDANEADCAYIAQACPDLLDRFIIQVYHLDEYDTVRSLGFENIILTMYCAYTEERDIEKICAEYVKNDYLGITVWKEAISGGAMGYEEVKEDWLGGDEFFKTMTRMDIPVYIHTVNDKETIVKSIESGVSGVYTDIVDRKGL